MIAELFLDGTQSCLFTFAELLAYSKNDQDQRVNALLDRIEFLPARNMIRKMISLNPSNRGSAQEYLYQWISNGFPPYFETMHEYISHLIPTDSETRISAVHHDFSYLLLMMKSNAPDSAAPDPPSVFYTGSLFFFFSLSP